LYNPGFYDKVAQLYPQGSEEAAAVEELFSIYGGQPRQVGSGLAKNEIPNARAAIDALTAQDARSRTYSAGLESLYPGQIRDNHVMQQGMNPNQGIQELLMKGPQTAARDKEAFNVARAGVPLGQIVDPAMRRAAERAIQQGATPGGEFTYDDWSGYVPPVPREDIEEQRGSLDIATALYDLTREMDPNRSWQETRLSMKDTSTDKTSQKNTGTDFAISDANEDFTPYEPPAGITGGAGFRPNVGQTFDYSKVISQDMMSRAAANLRNLVDPEPSLADLRPPSAPKKAQQPARAKPAPSAPVNIPPVVAGANPVVRRPAPAPAKKTIAGGLDPRNALKKVIGGKKKPSAPVKKGRSGRR
jgi:hypothetical protein